MNYGAWCEQVFNTPPGIEPVTWDFSPPMYDLAPQENLDFIDQALLDPRIPRLYSKEQIGNGLQLIFNNACSHLPFSYLDTPSAARRCQSVARLHHLYRNYFAPFCQTPVIEIGDGLTEGPLGYICDMFWDIFILHPGHENVTEAMIQAALGVMAGALKSNQDRVIVSALHGLGHWVYAVPPAQRIIEHWLQKPTTTNETVLVYAHQAWSGCIL